MFRAIIFWSVLLAPAAVGAQTVEEVTARVVAYVERYQKEFQGVTATEAYVQQERVARSSRMPRILPVPRRNLQDVLPIEIVSRRTRMESHLLLVPVANSAEQIWSMFRDVYAVDGKPVRNREERLKDLFLDPAKQPDLRRVDDENSRYNIGRVGRNFNMPLLALGFAHPTMKNRFRFRKGTEERRDNRTVWVLLADEQQRPTLIRTPLEDDVPAKARFWVDPESGAVLETELVVQEPRAAARATITVIFAPDEGLGMLVPARMEEVYDYPGRPPTRYTWGLATYAEFRRFTVSTTETFR
jgi:hypothetical protein